MSVPSNVQRFEALLYASLMLDSLSVAVQDRTPTVETTEQMIMTGTVLAGGMILLMVYFVRLAAHGRKNWPRWVLAAALVLSVISLAQILGERGLELDSAIEIVSCVLTTFGLYFSFTGDAQGWFNA
jgi:protein-S-isoprenylcysteine O-methyltransferase Ste14